MDEWPGRAAGEIKDSFPSLFFVSPTEQCASVNQGAESGSRQGSFGDLRGGADSLNRTSGTETWAGMTPEFRQEQEITRAMVMSFPVVGSLGGSIVEGVAAGDGKQIATGVIFLVLDVSGAVLAARGGGAAARANRLRAGEAGSYSSLNARGTVGDGLTPHHMPQAALGYTGYGEGGALAMPHTEHVLTRPYGANDAATAAQEAGLPFRTVLARDINDVRRIVGTNYDQGLLDLIEYYRTNFPHLLAK